jgi:pimeloyl-ACP methyl ester carboxylesterase
MVKRFKSTEGKRLIYESYDKLLELWGVDKEELDIDTPYGKTHVIVSENKANPPLLLFHSSGDNSVMTWFPNIKDFIQHFYVIAVDYFGGAGKSEPNEDFSKKFDVVIWVNRVLDFLDIKKTNVAGVSYGGYLALAYTVNNPDRVRKVVCMANYPYVKSTKGYFMTFSLVFRTARVLFPEVLNLTEDKAVQILQKYTEPNCDVLSFFNKEMRRQWFYIFKHSKVGTQKLTFFDQTAMNVFREKVLFLIGDSDRLMNHPAIINIFRIYKLNYKIINNAGHVLNYEQPALINKETADFLLT